MTCPSKDVTQTCNIVQNAEPSVADPSGLIPGWTSYRVHFTTSLGPDTTIRMSW
jgi:hypothetical protein